MVGVGVGSNALKHRVDRIEKEYLAQVTDLLMRAESGEELQQSPISKMDQFKDAVSVILLRACCDKFSLHQFDAWTGDLGCDFSSPFDRDVALTLAAESGNVEIVRRLLRMGARVNTFYSPLTLAAANGHAAIVRILLESGGVWERIQFTALDFACCSGHLEIVKMFLESGGGDGGLPLSSEDAMEFDYEYSLVSYSMAATPIEYLIDRALESNQPHIVEYLRWYRDKNLEKPEHIIAPSA